MWLHIFPVSVACNSCTCGTKDTCMISQLGGIFQFEKYYVKYHSISYASMDWLTSFGVKDSLKREGLAHSSIAYVMKIHSVKHVWGDVLNRNYPLYKALLKEKQFGNTKWKYWIWFYHQETEIVSVAEKRHRKNTRCHKIRKESDWAENQPQILISGLVVQHQNLTICQEKAQIQYYSRYLATTFVNELSCFLRLAFMWTKPWHRQEKRSSSGFDRAFSSQIHCWEIFHSVIQNLNSRLKICNSLYTNTLRLRAVISL